MDITEWYPITTDCLQQEEGDWAPANCPLADVPPGVVRKAASNMTLSNMKIDDNPEKCEQEVWINRKLHSPWVCVIHQYGRQNSDMRQNDSQDVAECSPITSDCLQPEKGNCLSHALCDDSVALKPLIQIIKALFSDDGDTTVRSGHDTDDGGSPAGLLGYLPWCLYWPRSLHGMTQCLAKIKGPSVNILTRVIMNDGGIWDVRISVTLPATYTGMEIHPIVIGLRASVGGSAASSDWLGVLGPADGPPGGIWIGFMRRTVQHEQSIVAVTVTGSLDFLTLASRRDANSIYRPSTLPEYCHTAWNWPLLCRTDSIAMDAAGFSIVDNRAGVTFGVELYVPWDAPEMSTERHCATTRCAGRVRVVWSPRRCDRESHSTRPGCS